MFGDSISIMETTLITAIGMGTVFVVLMLLVVVLSLFKFIPSDTPKTLPTPSQNTKSNGVEVALSPIEKAVITSAILEYHSSELKDQKVRIKSIRKVN
ncbi:MAG: OadG family transporter subunit [Brevinema sp.]